jgi:flagellar protein FlaF
MERLLDDLNSPENGLPDALHAGIISIGIWVNKEIDRIRSGATHDLSPLIEIQPNHPRRIELRRS